MVNWTNILKHIYSRNVNVWVAGDIHRETPITWTDRIQELSEWYLLEVDTSNDNETQGWSNFKQYLTIAFLVKDAGKDVGSSR